MDARLCGSVAAWRFTSRIQDCRQAIDFQKPAIASSRGFFVLTELPRRVSEQEGKAEHE
jgi:hypothetical protein